MASANRCALRGIRTQYPAQCPVRRPELREGVQGRSHRCNRRRRTRHRQRHPHRRRSPAPPICLPPLGNSFRSYIAAPTHAWPFSCGSHCSTRCASRSHCTSATSGGLGSRRTLASFMLRARGSTRERPKLGQRLFRGQTPAAKVLVICLQPLSLSQTFAMRICTIGYAHLTIIHPHNPSSRHRETGTTTTRSERRREKQPRIIAPPNDQHGCAAAPIGSGDVRFKPRLCPTSRAAPARQRLIRALPRTHEVYTARLRHLLRLRRPPEDPLGPLGPVPRVPFGGAGMLKHAFHCVTEVILHLLG